MEDRSTSIDYTTNVTSVNVGLPEERFFQWYNNLTLIECVLVIAAVFAVSCSKLP